MPSNMLLISALLLFSLRCSLGVVPRPRGVAISMASFYKAGAPFHCIDGSKEVPWEYVNDDYCDCPDGSDEPGTSACSNGIFQCSNAGFQPVNIVSSRVNDGICDCCDGTDEWSGNIECVNNCMELGQKFREERDRSRQLGEQGYKLRLQYQEDGKKTRDEKKVELATLEALKAELEVIKSDLEAKKADAEAPETEAKDKHKTAWDEEVEKSKAEKERQRSILAFNELDTNDDQKLDLAEIKANVQFDIDSNGEITNEEAKEHLEDLEVCDSEHFTEKVWPNIKDFYKPQVPPEEQAKGDNDADASNPEKVGLTKSIDPEDFKRHHYRHTAHPAFRGHPRNSLKATPTDITPPPVDDDDHYDDDEYYDDEDDDDDVNYEDVEAISKMDLKRHNNFPREAIILDPTPPVLQDDDDSKEDGEEEEEEKMPDYDDATNALIAAADEARREFSEAENKLQDTESQIRTLNSYLILDLGPDKEFGVLKGNCYEYTDREYIYKLCAFDRCSQKPKNGGSETTLGNWGHWEGPSDDKYSAQMYDNGQNCWNGPNRSVKVNLKCGLEHKFINAFEPSRCEYEFDFLTPCRCTAPTAGEPVDIHDEL